MSRDGSFETWSTIITTAQELADVYAKAIGDIFSTFPYCVRTPPDRTFLKSYPSQVACLDESCIAFLSRKRGAIESNACSLNSIDMLESETTLLASRLKVYPGDCSPLSLRYNAVSSNLFKPFIAAYKKSRGTLVRDADKLRALSPQPFEYLRDKDYRYYNYIQDALIDDHPESHFYHPATKAPSFLHRRRIISAYLLVASPSMLYCLSEEPPFRSSLQAEYSIMFRYMPFSSKICFLRAAWDNEERFSGLTVQSGSTTFKVPLAVGEEETFNNFAKAAAEIAR